MHTITLQESDVDTPCLEVKSFPLTFCNDWYEMKVYELDISSTSRDGYIHTAKNDVVQKKVVKTLPQI